MQLYILIVSFNEKSQFSGLRYIGIQQTICGVNALQQNITHLTLPGSQ